MRCMLSHVVYICKLPFERTFVLYRLFIIKIVLNKKIEICFVRFIYVTTAHPL